MIDPIRQDILHSLSELGEALPDWRFGQMIANLAVTARDATPEAVWDVEDEELLAAIHHLLDRRRARTSTPS